LQRSFLQECNEVDYTSVLLSLYIPGLEQLERHPLRGNISLFIHLYPVCMLLVYIASRVAPKPKSKCKVPVQCCSSQFADSRSGNRNMNTRNDSQEMGRLRDATNHRTRFWVIVPSPQTRKQCEIHYHTLCKLYPIRFRQRGKFALKVRRGARDL
jgi:hypothetical protein